MLLKNDNMMLEGLWQSDSSKKKNIVPEVYNIIHIFFINKGLYTPV